MSSAHSRHQSPFSTQTFCLWSGYVLKCLSQKPHPPVICRVTFYSYFGFLPFFVTFLTTVYTGPLHRHLPLMQSELLILRMKFFEYHPYHPAVIHPGKNNKKKHLSNQQTQTKLWYHLVAFKLMNGDISTIRLQSWTPCSASWLPFCHFCFGLISFPDCAPKLWTY